MLSYVFLFYCSGLPRHYHFLNRVGGRAYTILLHPYICQLEGFGMTEFEEMLGVFSYEIAQTLT